MTSPWYWLLFAFVVVGGAALIRDLTLLGRWTDRSLRLAEQRLQRAAEDVYWNLCRQTDFETAIGLAARRASDFWVDELLRRDPPPLRLVEAEA